MAVAISTLGWAAFELAVQDRPDSSDRERFAALARDRVRNHGEMNLLVRDTRFRDWSPAALWQDLKLDVAYYDDVFRLALVVEAPSREWLASLSKPFTGARVEFFPSSELKSAREWVRSGRAAPRSPGVSAHSNP
jgi:hypothetical protein